MCHELNLGAVSADMRQVVRQVKHDLKDDWYPDAHGYEDLLDVDTVSQALLEAIERDNGVFLPEQRTELNIPKKGFVLRYSLETSILDRVYYHLLVSQLVPHYDTLLPPQVLNHRYASTGTRAGRYLFLHPIERWRLFEGYVLEETSANPVVLVTDVQNYFENIQVDQLTTVLNDRVSSLQTDGPQKARLRGVISELNRCLRSWSYRPDFGLPQNRDASSFLANLVMLSVDEEMLGRGYRYYRYMDDIRIATSSRYRARAALRDLTVELRRLGLNVNAAKTKILEPHMPQYGAELRQREPALTQIDNMWRSRALPVIRRSFEPLQQLAVSLIGQGSTQERAFRFCVKRFENIALCPEIQTPPGFFDQMIDAAIQGLDDQPCSSDQLIRFLKAAPTTDGQMQRVGDFLRDEEKALYDWQNYLLWQLLVFKQHSDDALRDLARARIGNLGRHADRAGAMLYLGATGTADDRLLVAQAFNNCDAHLLQRNALIAVHELDFHNGVEQHVAPHVLPSLRGSYRRLRDRFHGQYHQPLPPVSALDLYDEVTSYE